MLSSNLFVYILFQFTILAYYSSEKLNEPLFI